MSAKRLSALLIVVGLVVAACGGRTGTLPAVSLGPGADTPREAVRELVIHINTPDFNAASNLAVPNHAALASLAEGATFRAVADAIRDGDAPVAANFWAGFAQGTGSYLTGTVTTSDGPTLTQDGVEFHSVVVFPQSGGERSMLVQDADGFRIDLFASFGPGLADRMIPAVERLLSTQTDDARLILRELKAIVPSLLVAVAQPGLAPEAGQPLLQLIELITRVG